MRSVRLGERGRLLAGQGQLGGGERVLDVALLGGRDPSTSPLTARGMRAALGKRAVMVTVDHGGHGVIGRSRCADTAMFSFLATGALPKRDLFCPAASPADALARYTPLPYLGSAGPL